MGVIGLTTFISRNQEKCLMNHMLHDCNLVIDGHNLIAQLYEPSSCNSACGGDYDKYRLCVKKVFTSLKICNITPYVLFDGSSERRKLNTIYSRTRNKVRIATTFSPGNRPSGVFPLLLRDVFKEILIEMNVQFTVCEFEADDEIAGVARYLECPVLSYDSDFFIYNVLYIPQPSLSLKPEKVNDSFYALNCRIYNVQNFLNRFGGLKSEIMPLLATLLGNDYVSKKIFAKFFQNLKLPKVGKTKNIQQRTIQGLLNWLKYESFDSAVRKIIGYLKKENKDKVLQTIKKACNIYNNRHCESLQHLNLESKDVSKPELKPCADIIEQLIDGNSGGDSDSGSEHESVSSDHSNGGPEEEQDHEMEEKPGLIQRNDERHARNRLPDWFIRGLRQGHIAQPYLNLFTLHLYLGSTQIEDPDAPDAFLCALEILRFSFDILTDFNTTLYLTYVGREKKNMRNYSIRSDIPPDRVPQAVSKIPFLDRNGEEIKYFDLFLEYYLPDMSIELIKRLPNNIQIFMIAMLWWAQHCKNITMPHVYSLLLCVVMLDVIDERTQCARKYDYFIRKHAEKLEPKSKKRKLSFQMDENNLLLSYDGVETNDCFVAAAGLMRNFDMEKTVKICPKMFHPSYVHPFSQFQCCLQQFHYLNQLTGFSYPRTIFHRALNGTFLYNMFHRLSNREDPIEYIEQYISGADSVLFLFKSLVHVFNINSSIMAIFTVPVSVSSGQVRKKKKRRKKPKNNEESDPEETVVENVVKSDSDDDFFDANNKFNMLKMNVADA